MILSAELRCKHLVTLRRLDAYTATAFSIPCNVCRLPLHDTLWVGMCYRCSCVMFDLLVTGRRLCDPDKATTGCT
jgi:hypothetical protein